MNRQQPRDPDPLLMDLLINLAATGIAGVVVRAGRRFWNSRKRSQAVARPLTPDELGALRSAVEDLQHAIEQAQILVRPGSTRELGGQLILTPDRLAQYQQLRERLFDQVRNVDRLSELLFPAAAADTEAPTGRRARIPDEVRAQVRFIDKRLTEARVASVASEAFVEIQAAIVGMREVLRQIEPRARQ